MSKNYDISFSLSLLKRYVIYTFKHFYGEYIVVGRENIPTDCPVIFAPNHLNALMDALAVHSIVPQNLPVYFLARSDIFNNKIVAKALHFMNIMPAFRMRDGVENLGKNNEIFEQCVDVLHQNKAIGIMPEGNQGDPRKLRTFTKGIFRIAFAAQQKYGTQPTVKIVPVGIDYFDFYKFGKHIIINIGKPIEVSEYMNHYAVNPVTATNEIRDQLRNDLSNITLDLATEKHYKCFETATEVANSSMVKELKMPDKTIFRFVARQKIGKKLIAIEKNEPEKIELLESYCAEYDANIQKMNLRTWVLEKAPFKSSLLLLDGLLLLITLPIFIQGFILNLFPFFSPVLVRKAMKIEYKGFYSSIHYVFGIIISFPLFYFLQTLIFVYLTSFPWWIVLIFFYSQYFFGIWAFRWYKEAKKYLGRIRYYSLKSKKSSILEKTQNLRKKIIQLIIN